MLFGLPRGLSCLVTSRTRWLLVVVRGPESIHDAVRDNFSFVGRLLVVGSRGGSIWHIGRLKAIHEIWCLEVVPVSASTVAAIIVAIIKARAVLGPPLWQNQRVAGHRVVVASSRSWGGGLVGWSSGGRI